MGPLSGFRIIEMKGIGPGPYAGMVLADLGAEVIVVERSSQPGPLAPPSKMDVCSRGKKSIVLDLKTESGLNSLLDLVESAHGLFEGFGRVSRSDWVLVLKSAWREIRLLSTVA